MTPPSCSPLPGTTPSCSLTPSGTWRPREWRTQSQPSSLHRQLSCPERSLCPNPKPQLNGRSTQKRRELGCDCVLHSLGLQVPDGVKEQLGVVPGKGEQEGGVIELVGLVLVAVHCQHVAKVQLQGQRLHHLCRGQETLSSGGVIQDLCYD